MENNIVWIAEIIDTDYCCAGSRGIVKVKAFSTEKNAIDWAITTAEAWGNEWTEPYEFKWEVYALTLDQPNA